LELVFTASKQQSIFADTHTIIINDICLERLYNILKVYLELYPNNTFKILRTPKTYKLIFRGESPKGGAF